MEYNERIEELINGIASYRVENDIKRGYALAGCNGPYQDNDTPIRNTSHWIITYSYLYRVKHDERYKTAALKFLDYVLSENNYGENGAAICRNDNKVDHTNGVIGQAWVIEALVYAYVCFDRKDALDRALAIYRTPKYDYDAHSWIYYDVDGSCVGFDVVFNHQLWFAACASKLIKYSKDEELRKAINDFTEHCTKIFYTHSCGLLYHRGNMRHGIKNKVKFWGKMSLCEIAHSSGLIQNYNRYYLEKGYHLFDLYGFALLKTSIESPKLYDSRKLRSAVDYANNKSFANSLMTPNKKDFKVSKSHNGKKYNLYAYDYNSPAFEYPFVASVLMDKVDYDLCNEYLDNQIALNYSEEKHAFCKGVNDSETLTARIYELVRYLDMVETI